MTTWIAYIVLTGEIYISISGIKSELDCEMEIRKAMILDSFTKEVCIKQDVKTLTYKY